MNEKQAVKKKLWERDKIFVFFIQTNSVGSFRANFLEAETQRKLLTINLKRLKNLVFCVGHLKFLLSKKYIYKKKQDTKRYLYWRFE